MPINFAEDATENDLPVFEVSDPVEANLIGYIDPIKAPLKAFRVAADHKGAQHVFVVGSRTEGIALEVHLHAVEEEASVHANTRQKMVPLYALLSAVIVGLVVWLASNLANALMSAVAWFYIVLIADAGLDYRRVKQWCRLHRPGN
jgi:hypothetical protein